MHCGFVPVHRRGIALTIGFQFSEPGSSSINPYNSEIRSTLRKTTLSNYDLQPTLNLVLDDKEVQ
jgi:hypothetical protein